MLLLVLRGLSVEGAPAERVANTTLNLPPGGPQPVATSFTTTNAFGDLIILFPVGIIPPPAGETNRLFVLEQPGRVVVITNLAAPSRTIFLDLSDRVVTPNEMGLLGMVFHPGHATNRQFYLFYSLETNTPAGDGYHQRLAMFHTDPDNPNAALPESEQPILDLYDRRDSHNGGDMLFGNDGYLYVAMGDEGGANDPHYNAQQIDQDFWSGILRIDVDRRAGNHEPNPHPGIHPGTYRVPADNPFVGITHWNGTNVVAEEVRTEFYAYGLRNPWRIHLDRATGHLYAGDVGQDFREEIDIIVPGGNYGWAFQEGDFVTYRERPPGVDPIPPILQYVNGSEDGRAVIGGVVYRGSRYPSLHGHYLFGDFSSGRIWSTYYDGNSATPKQWVASVPFLSAFGTDPHNGDILIADYGANRIRRLVAATTEESDFPQTLSATGVFADLESLTPNPGILSYEVNVPFWSDHARKRRWFAMPNPDLQLAFQPEGNWSFPTGTVWIKHFEMEMTEGVPSSRRRLETRLLVRETFSGGVYGVTYRWNAEGTDAELVGEEGEAETLMIQEAEGIRTQVWRYPSRAECLSCHTAAAGYALGFNTAQLNRDVAGPEGPRNQLVCLAQAGYFDADNLTNRHLLRALAPSQDATVSVEQRVRSYLMVNCGPCHQAGGPGRGTFNVNLYAPLPESGLVLGQVLNDLGNPDYRTITPGDPGLSMLHTRMSLTGEGRMPPVGPNLVDATGLGLLARWITNSLPGYLSFEAWQTNHFGASDLAQADPDADPDGDGDRNKLEHLARTNPNDPLSRSTPLRIEKATPGVLLRFERLVNRGFEVQFSTSPEDPGSWRPLNVPSNQPFFSADPALHEVGDPSKEDPARFYRIRVYEP